MTDPGEVLSIAGGEQLPLAAALSARGLNVHLIIPDPDDRARITSLAARIAPALHVRAAGPAASGQLNWSGVNWSLDWQVPASLVFHPGPDEHGIALIECRGAASGPVRRLAARLDAELVEGPGGQPPASVVVQAYLGRVVEELMLSGAAPVQIDEAAGVAGLRPGPLLMQDARGVDRMLAARSAYETLAALVPRLPLVPRAVAEGRLGRSAGVGWYRYPGGGGPVEDPLVEDMAAEEARFAGITQTFPSDDEVSALILKALQQAHDVLGRAGMPQANRDRVAQLVLGMGTP